MNKSIVITVLLVLGATVRESHCARKNKLCSMPEDKEVSFPNIDSLVSAKNQKGFAFRTRRKCSVDSKPQVCTSQPEKGSLLGLKEARKCSVDSKPQVRTPQYLSPGKGSLLGLKEAREKKELEEAREKKEKEAIEKKELDSWVIIDGHIPSLGEGGFNQGGDYGITWMLSSLTRLCSASKEEKKK